METLSVGRSLLSAAGGAIDEYTTQYTITILIAGTTFHSFLSFLIILSIASTEVRSTNDLAMRTTSGPRVGALSNHRSDCRHSGGY